MPRGNTEFKELFRALALGVGNVTRITQGIPVGEGWDRLILRVNHVVTIGTGAGPRVDGALLAITGVTLRSDRGDRIVDNVPGRPLYLWDRIKAGTAPRNDAILAANGTYSTQLSIWFIDPLSQRPQDTILDTSRFSAMTLEIGYGTVANLYTAPGTATVAPTVDIYVERTRGLLPKNVKPVIGMEYGIRPAQNPSTQTYIDLERAANLTYKRLALFSSNTTAAGDPAFSGIADDAQITDWTLDHDKGKPYETILDAILQQKNKDEFSQEAAISGWRVIDLMADRSLNSSLWSGAYSRLRAMWTNGVLGAATPMVSLAYEGIRPLR